MRSLTTSTLSEVGVVMIEEYVVCGVNMYVNVCMYVCKNKLKSIIIQYSSTKYLRGCAPEFSESDAQINLNLIITERFGAALLEPFSLFLVSL